MSALLDSLAEGFKALPTASIEALDLGPSRRAALQHGLAHDLPSQRAEGWKYTALRALGARRFAFAAEVQAVDAAALAAIPAPRLVFVNGRHDAGLSRLPAREGVKVRPLSAGLADASAGLREALATPPRRPDQVFASLNDALAIEGAWIEVAPGADAGALNLVFVSTPAATDFAVHLRHLVRLGEGARLNLAEHHLSAGPHRHLVNHQFDLQVGDNAQMAHARLQDEDAGASLVASTSASIGSAASYRRVDLELGAALSRHDLSITLMQGARCASGGVLLADGRRHLDTRLGVTHAARDSSCDLVWRGLAADRARVAFLGAITIAAGADGSDASLSAKNLLLSPGAEIDAQPVLEIHADEVKAAHGATVGRLDPTALFYLRSRGIAEPQARALLTQSFCREALRPLADDQALALLVPRLEARLLDSPPTP